MKDKILVVGAGLTGSTLAERFANSGEKVVLIDRRDHIAGNCFDYYNKDGILVPKYGPHMFHTNHDDVWEYVNKFSEWIPYEHRVLSYVDKKLVPVPVNITTVNKIYNKNIQTEEEMQKWLSENVEKIENPRNGEEASISRVGKGLYEKMFKHYTKKHWDLWPHELEASVLNRIPVRTNFDDRYFTDKYLGMPKDGFTKLVSNIINHPNITLRLKTSYERELHKAKKVFFTGSVDEFFSFKHGKLEYRSQVFKHKTLDQEYYQPVAVVNYPNNFKFTRITEPKHATGQKHAKTTIIKEYSKWEGEPSYPVPTQRNRDLHGKYQEEVQKLEDEGTYFAGRLGQYKYLNMDQAFKDAFTLFERTREK